MSSADSKSKELMDTAMKTFFADMQKTIQQCDEVAEVIKDLLLTDKPHLRYQTSERFMTALTNEKFSDLSGDSTVESITKWWFPEN